VTIRASDEWYDEHQLCGKSQYAIGKASRLEQGHQTSTEPLAVIVKALCASLGVCGQRRRPQGKSRQPQSGR